MSLADVKAQAKLFKVTLQGMHGDPGHGIAYVIAQDAGEAYRKLRERLDDKGLGFVRERELQSVELLADSAEFPAVRRLLL